MRSIRSRPGPPAGGSGNSRPGSATPSDAGARISAPFDARESSRSSEFVENLRRSGGRVGQGEGLEGERLEGGVVEHEHQHPGMAFGAAYPAVVVLADDQQQVAAGALEE